MRKDRPTGWDNAKTQQRPRSFLTQDINRGYRYFFSHKGRTTPPLYRRTDFISGQRGFSFMADFFAWARHLEDAGWVD